MKHLILDAGGVLVYPRMGNWHIPCRAAEILGDERARIIGSDAYLTAQDACFEWLDEGRLIPDVATERLLRRGFVLDMDRKLNWHLTDDEIAALADDFTDNPDRYGFFDDVDAYLARRQGRYKLGVLSDAMPSLDNLLELRGIRKYFDAVVISACIGATKPDPKMYTTIMERLNADAADCVFVDDRASNLMGAVAVGMHAVQMSRPEFPAVELWDGPVVHNFEELDAFLTEGTL